jgi:predicted CxxxxCH...CXXCH cytochrome family protein
VDLAKNLSTDALGVGAHQSHLLPSDDFAAIECNVCHQVPESVDEAGHISGNNPGQSEIHFDSLASPLPGNATWHRTTETCSNTYCHGSDTPVWTEVDGSWNSCDNCHGIPSGGIHSPGLAWTDCYLCHDDVINQAGNIIAPELHVNGEPD